MSRLAWLLALAACGGGGSTTEPIEPGPDGGPSCSASIQLGTGVREFQAVTDGDTVYLYSGPQGGYMVYLSVRAMGMDPSDCNLCYTETFTNGAPLGKGCWRIILTNDLGGGVHERVGVWGQVDPSFWHSPQLIRSHDIHIDATLTDKIGCSASAGWRVHVSPDSGP